MLKMLSAICLSYVVLDQLDLMISLVPFCTIRSFLAIFFGFFFRCSLDKGFFPTMFKLSLVTPVPNLIAPLLFPIIGQYQFNFKSEKCLNLLFWTLFNRLLAISLWMSSFHPGCFIFTCVISYFVIIFLSQFQCSQVNVIYTNFKKAFDSVNHEVLYLSTFLMNLDLAAYHYCFGLNHIFRSGTNGSKCSL